MSEIKFNMREVTEKRKKRYQKRSIYDPMIDQFLNSGYSLVEIEVKGKRGSYIAAQLSGRIKARELEDKIEASAASGFAYLEKKA